jgi:AdoMet-dependent heme synthase
MRVEAAAPMTVPTAPFSRLSALWIQITGTWCNLECVHCINASGPKHPWLRPLATDAMRRAIKDAERLGVKEIYFTGGEPFLHKDILEMLELSLQVAPTTVLTNGTLIDERLADALADLARGSAYSFELRVSVDGIDPARNDRIRGVGSWDKAIQAIRLLAARGLVPILTATEILRNEEPGQGMYQRFVDLLRAMGIDKPRVKIMPVFPIGRMARPGGPRLTHGMLEGFDFSLLQCAESRVVAAGGVYACPILAGLPEARLSEDSLDESLRPASLFHPACVTCYETGMTCRNA